VHLGPRRPVGLRGSLASRGTRTCHRSFLSARSIHIMTECRLHTASLVASSTEFDRLFESCQLDASEIARNEILSTTPASLRAALIS
jgi:hypothetical protein